MCGICGVIGIQRAELAEEITRRMMGALEHRGPDEDGILVAPSAALGMRRLSIIDLPGGHQPVFNETGNVAVVFNGEIYNFPQLRKTLEGRGHTFRTHSDTEVIVHAYEEWGEQCLRELRGMFAIAIWDARSSGTSGDGARHAQIFLARDRLGIKPLYYAAAGGALLFSSEVRSLLASGRLQPRLSPDSLEAFLTFGSVVEPSTLVEGVFSVPPGHCLAFPADAPPAKPTPKPYWIYSDAVLQQEGPPPKTFQEAAKLLRPLLEETVREHLIADVPLGVFLSSGLDSTSLVALGQPLPERPAHIYGRISRAAVQRSQDFARNGQTLQNTPSGSSPRPGYVGGPIGGCSQVAGPAHHGWPEYLLCVASRAPGRIESGSLGARQR